MSRNRFLSAILLALMLSISCQCSNKEQENTKRTGASYLPSAEYLGAWQEADAPRLFTGDDLFLYINGGAEIYHEYGFKQVLVQEYRSKAGKSIGLEIFEMIDDKGAYGMYTFKTGDSGDEIEVGNAGLLESYYINFWKGNYLITLTGFDDSQETVDGLKKISKAVDAGIEPGGNIPGLANALRVEGLPGQNIKYIRGNLGIQNSYPFFFNIVFTFEEAVKGDYENDVRLFVLKYDDPRVCLHQFSELMRQFKSSSKYENFKNKGELFSTVDRKGNFIISQIYRYFIIIIISPDQEPRVHEILNGVKLNIERIKGLL